MASQTQNYHYPKPEEEDFYDVGEFNRAMDMIDEDIKQVEEAIPAAVRVKGAAESSYRTGDVNITPENIGLGNVPNVSTNNQTPTFTQASTRVNIINGEKLSVIFGKIMKWFADLKTVAFSGKYTDLTDRPTIPAAVRVKGNAESAYRTGDVNLTSANIGAASNEYISENFVPGYVSTVRANVKDTGWYRIAQVQSQNGYSCVISLKRRYNLPAPEYQKVQFLRAYTNVKFVPIASISDSHIWTQMRMTRDNASGKDYIEVYQNVNSNANMWVVTIEDALGSIAADNWKTMSPELTQETVDGVTVVTSVNLPANLDLDFFARKDGSNVTGTWSNLTTGNAIKATQDSNGKVIKDTYLPMSGGTITGNLRLKGSGNYGNTLNFGDGDYVHISEPTDDHLEIKGSYINFVTSATGTGRFTLNGKDILTIDKIYPVGSIYMSVNSTNPGTLFGGTWVRWGNGRALVSVNESETEFNSVEKVGGEKTHVITTAEMPSHTHSVKAQTVTTSTNGKHTHSGHSNQDIASGTSSKNRIVKGGDNTVSGFLLENGDHSHTVTIPASTTGSTGSGVGHNNLPPYITCYMWKRTA